MHEELLTAQRRVLGPDHPDTLTTLLDLGEDYYDQHRYAEAEATQREAIDHLIRAFGPRDRQAVRGQSSLALTLAHEGRYDEAEEQLRNGMQAAQAMHDRRLMGGLAYDGACVAAVAGRREAAFAHMREAMGFNYGTADEVATDADLQSLHGDPQFEAIVTALRQRAAAAK